MSKTLIVEGRPEAVLMTALHTYRIELKKARKKDEAMNQPTASHDADDKIALDMLTQLGYVPADSKGSKRDTAEVVDDRQASIFDDHPPAPKARVKCIGCTTLFAVPEGDRQVACPECGVVHRVKSGDGGTVYMAKRLARIPEEIAELVRRRDSDDLAPLTPTERMQLIEWMTANPDAVDPDTFFPKGERVADPTVPGSGNPLRIDCRSIHGSEIDCDGFDSTDTPGEALCPHCGHKTTVELLDGVIIVKPYSPEDDRGPASAPEA